MSRLFCVDPGLRTCGVALFEDGFFVDAALAVHRNGDGPNQWVGMGNAVVEWIGSHGRRRPTDELVVEYMQTRKGRADAHDALIQLSQVSGVIYANGPDNRFHAPAGTWTGRRPKSKNHDRIRRRLNDGEIDRLEHALGGVLKSSQKELLDAVGIGLWHLDRL